MANLQKNGLRSIAVVEAAKGLLVLMAGFGLLSLLHQDLQTMAELLVGHLHLNPASHYPRIFLNLADHLSDSGLRWLAALALLYASIRFSEAYGLWHERRWAEWLGALSGGIYIPFELYEIAHGITGLKIVTLLINVLVFAYLALLLWQVNLTVDKHAALSKPD